MSVADKLLDRLTLVKKTGPNRWIARCPAHEDRSPSLSIRELDDGRLLIHDFGGCSTDDVMGAIGLSVADLFERPVGQHLPPSHSRIPARDLLEIVDHELTVAALILQDVLAARTVTQEQCDRLTTAAGRIGKARAHART